MSDQDRPGNSLATPVSILLAGIIIAGAVMFSNGGFNFGDKAAPEPTVAGTQDAPEQPSVPASQSIKVETDGDPFIGDANAPVTLVEFSDFECPYCQRLYNDAYQNIKADYVDSGQVKIYFRDLPLPGHGQIAIDKAIAANCAREQGGDQAYFNYHDQLFERFTSDPEDLPVIANLLGLNMNEFATCQSDPAIADEVSADFAYAPTIGANGTPAVYVGKSSDSGIIDAQLVSGAQPYTVFKAAIDAALAN